MTRWIEGRGALIALPLLALLPLGCATTTEVRTLDLVDPRLEFTKVQRDYTDMDERYSRAGMERTLTGVRSVAIGDSKQELQQAIGEPVVTGSDGAWEFHLALPLTERDHLVCQYLVFFDTDEQVKGTAWRRPQCADLTADGRNA